MSTKLLRFLLLINMLTVVASVYGNSFKQALVLNFKDGSRIAYFLETRPVLSFQGLNLHVVSGDVAIDYPLSNISKHTFENIDPSAIAVYKVGTESIRVEGNKLVWSGLAVGQYIRIYTLDGQSVADIRIGNDGMGEYFLHSCPLGLYIIKYGKSTLKILKR